jgi:hypothetical protein
MSPASPQSCKLLLLEDSPRRFGLFEGAARKIPNLTLHRWTNAPEFIRDLPNFLSGNCVLSLDYELTGSGVENPGTGLDVTRFLASRSEKFPVILHTSDSYCAGLMAAQLQSAGWKTYRITPAGIDWAERSWLPKVQALLGIDS